jgi:hypothetical protein
MYADSPQRPVERREGLSRWEEVLAPSFKIVAPSRRSGDITPRWLKWTKEHQAVKEL